MRLCLFQTDSLYIRHCHIRIHDDFYDIILILKFQRAFLWRLYLLRNIPCGCLIHHSGSGNSVFRNYNNLVCCRLAACQYRSSTYHSQNSSSSFHPLFHIFLTPSPPGCRPCSSSCQIPC